MKYKIKYYCGIKEREKIIHLPHKERFVQEAIDRDASVGTHKRLRYVEKHLRRFYEQIYTDTPEFAIWYFVNFEDGGAAVYDCEKVDSDRF